MYEKTTLFVNTMYLHYDSMQVLIKSYFETINSEFDGSLTEFQSNGHKGQCFHIDIRIVYNWHKTSEVLDAIKIQSTKHFYCEK